MAAAVPGGDDDIFFRPNDDKLVDRYLRAKIDGKLGALPNSCFFHDVDVCSARPDVLVRDRMAARVPSGVSGDGQQWYFFSPVRFVGGSTKRKSRTIAGTDEKESWHTEGRPKPVKGGGYMEKFSYHVRIGKNKLEKPGWIMAEYTFGKNTRDGDTALCKVYRSPRCSKKRKAADDLVEATPTTRPRRQTEEAQVQQAPPELPELVHVEEEPLHEPVFVGEVMHDQLPVVQDQTAALPEFPELFNLEEGPPPAVPLHAPVFAGEVRHLPHEEQDAPDQTVFGPLITAIATGFRFDELFIDDDGPSMSCPHPCGGGAPDILCT